MPSVYFGSVPFDAWLIVFDKDGTLIDFEYMWGRLARAWADALAAGPDAERLRRELHRSWGYDLRRRRTRAQSPLAIATTGQLQTIAAVTLYRHRIPWPEAEDRARWAFEGTQAGADWNLESLVRPAGDVRSLMQQLKAAGVRVAVVTTDHRAQTLETLRLLQVTDEVDTLVCGDDGWPSKPAPEMLLAACKRLGIEPEHTAIIGDTEADMLMGLRAGAGVKVGVLTGAGDPRSLRTHADVVVASIDEIRLRR